MITLSAAVIESITNNTGYFYCVKFTDKSGTVQKRVTSHYADVTLSDGVTYLANGTLKAVDPPVLDTVVNRSQFRLQISDPSYAQDPSSSNGFIGMYIEARLCFIKNDANPDNRLPLTTLTDTLLIYRGKINGASYLIQTEEIGEVILQVTGASPMADLNLKKSIYLSRDYIRNKNPNDACCDMIYAGSGTLGLRWGRT